MNKNIIKILVLIMLFGIPSIVSADDSWLEESSIDFGTDDYNVDGCYF